MAHDYSGTARRRMNQVESQDLGVYLLMIDHADLVEPIRLVNDNADILHNGHTWIALPFTITPPSDISQGQPKGRIEIANVGREIMPWLDQSAGGNGALITMRYIFRQFPDSVEWEITGLLLTDLQATTTHISASIGFEDILNMPAVALRYTPTSQPGIF